MGNFGRALPRFLIAFLALILALQGLTAHSSISSSANNSNSNPSYQSNSWFFLSPGWSIGSGSGGSSDYGNSGGSSWFDSGSGSSDGGGWDSGGGDSGSWGGDGGSDSGSW